jgi:hypothetical protein
MSYPPLVPMNVSESRQRPEQEGQVGRDLDPELVELLRSHAEREAVALEAYRHLATKSRDKGIRYLVRMILEDERRHHDRMQEMVNTIQSFTWDVDVQPRVPSLEAKKDPLLLEETRLLLKFEQEDARELRRLKKHLGRASHSSLLPLLTELMIHDSAKHAAILQYIRAQTSR